MKIVFSSHANLKIEQREISKDLVVSTIENPEFQRPSYGSRIEVYKNWGKNHLKVVIIKELDAITVITTHWVAKVGD